MLVRSDSVLLPNDSKRPQQDLIGGLLPASPQVQRFEHAIVRTPGPNFHAGLTTMDLGAPDFEIALAQHEKYIGVLRRLGLNVTVLEADSNYPDGCFVEDTLILTDEFAVLTNPGAATRRDETQAMQAHIPDKKIIRQIESPGTLDGGDVLRIGNTFYIGLSDRTNRDGALQLARIVEEFGYRSVAVLTEGALHLKTGVTYIGKNTLIGVENFLKHSVFDSYRKIALPDSEAYAANCLYINGQVVLPEGFPTARRAILDLHLGYIQTPMSEFQKMDGGLTCLSVLY